MAGLTARTLVANYALIAMTIVPDALPRPVSRDTDDDQVIACALAARADAIVSADDDLLSLGAYEGIDIVTVLQALKRIEQAEGVAPLD